MADYSIIADVSNYIVRMLREKMCPEQILSPNDIQIAVPSFSKANFIVGLYLYDMKEEAEIAFPQLIRKERQQLQRPPRPYTLYYMIYINDPVRTGAGKMQEMIGRVAQILNDSEAVSTGILQAGLEEAEPPFHLSRTEMTLEEKAGVWQALHKPFQMSLFYKAGPVFLSSGTVIDVPVVTEAVFGLKANVKKEGNDMEDG